MLACNVSQSHRRAAIAVNLAETAAARDSLGTGNIVFATLVDDPASVGDRVDAFLGEIMREAASAAATVNAGLAYAIAVVEAASAADVSSASVPGVYSGTVSEAAAAADSPDATTTAAVAKSQIMSASRVGSAVVSSDGTKTQIIAGIGAVT